jgi:hypothetical protein
MSSSWRSPWRLDLITWEKMPRMKTRMRMTMTEEVPSHPYCCGTTPAPAPHAAAPEEIIEEEDPVEMVPEQEAPVAHEVILAYAEPKLLQPRLYRTLTRDYE